MALLHRRFIGLFTIHTFLSIVDGGTYSIRILTDTYINEVDAKFLSFQIDPKFLFSKSKQYQSKESICMAAALAPAYLQIAGPSTSQMTFQNYTITLQDKIGNTDNSVASDKNPLNPVDDKNSLTTSSGLVVTPHQWSNFVKWAQKTGFDLVFALNNEEKTDTGLWDPNSTLSILTVAEIANMSNVYWQLGYKCSNQSIEEYLNDLETLRVITETFPTQGWKVIGSDVTSCLRGNSDFKDYVTLAVDMMDTVILNGNSTAREISLLSTQDRYRLIHLLTKSTTPLWLTDSPLKQNHLERAADWITSLGNAARNGFSVHFRELVEEEIYEPTLSFYMALLYKNLVGERVLSLEDDDDQASIFAHCTSLRQKPVPGALTLYAVNMEDEPARYSIKLTKKENGGDIMQFILGRDNKGNIMVNGKPMHHEGDIRPIVKRVRPYKTLLLNLPSKSFGFWVLANTKIQACQDITDKFKKVNETKGVNNKTVTEATEHDTVKRSISLHDTDDTSSSDSVEISGEDNVGNQIAHPVLQEGIDFINKDLKNIRQISTRYKRQFFDFEDNKPLNKDKKTQRKQALKSLLEKLRNADMRPKFDILRRILELNPKINFTRTDKSNNSNNEKGRRIGRLGKSKVNKRNTKYLEMTCDSENEEKKQHVTEYSSQRQKRSILNENNFKPNKNTIDKTKENEIDVDNKDNYKLKKILHTLHKELYNLPLIEHNTKQNDIDSMKYYTDESFDADSEQDLETEKSKMRHGIINSTLKNVVLVLNEMNKKVERFWNALNIYD